MEDAPLMLPYRKHVFICVGLYCDPQRQAERLYAKLGQRLVELGLADYEDPSRIKRSKTPCLGICIDGPILVVYPDGIWYHHVDDALLERILQEHIIGGRPVEEAIFHRLGAPAMP